MIEWTDELIGQIGSYSRAALSYPGPDGYPVALPLPFTFDPVEHRFTFPAPAPPQRPASSSEDRASLTLLRYDPQMANEHFLLFYGQLTERGDTWAFTPTRVVIPRWGGRE